MSCRHLIGLAKEVCLWFHALIRVVSRRLPVEAEATSALVVKIGERHAVVWVFTCHDQLNLRHQTLRTADCMLATNKLVLHNLVLEVQLKHLLMVVLQNYVKHV